MKTNKFIAWIGGLCTFMFILNSCNDNLDGKTFFTTDEMTIIGTLESNPEKFSMYLDLIKKTDSYNALKSYGSYTVFVPTNEALQAFLQENFNVSSVDEITTAEQIEYFKTLVNFHTMARARYTDSFIEGRLPDTTYTGDFLTTSFLKGGGIANVEINREVSLDQYDIRTNNGVIHAINGVMNPFVDPVPVVMDKAGQHTIFVEAMKQTGYYDEFSVVFNEFGAKTNFTILAETDVVYAQEGINSFNELVARISPDDSDFTNPENELNRFVAYHATRNFLYSSDFPDDSFITTVLENNAIKSYKTDKELKINETETGTNDTWTSIVAADSNYPAKNGVYHSVDKLFSVFTPQAKHVFFDVIGSQPEYQSGLIASHERVLSTAWSGIRWFPEAEVRYLRSSQNANASHTVLDIGGYAWVEFDTPVIPKGKYQMNIMSNGGNNARGIFQVYFDGEPIGSVYDLTLKGDSGGNGFPDEALMDSKGWMLGYPETITPSGERIFVNNEGVSQSQLGSYSRFIVARELLIPIQKTHIVRLETVKAGGSPIDFIEWIPVE